MKLTPKTTLAEFARNADGKTYNGVKLVIFMIYGTTGVQITDAEAEAVVAEAKSKALAKAKACPK